MKQSLSRCARSVEAIRAQFPALLRRHGGCQVAYFDGPGGTQVPRSVADAMADYLLNHNANTHWGFPTSQETDLVIAGARQALGDFLKAAPSEIIFGPNMTTLTFHLSRALGRRLGPGDEIVATELDHHANLAPWQALVRERGITLRMARMNLETGQLDWDDLQSQLNERTKLLAIGAASNALGTINDVARAAQLAHEVGAWVFVDAVHYAPHRLVDVTALGCDFLACSAYKFYGPHLGILFGKYELLQELDVPKLEPAPSSAPERWETGTQNHEGIAGAAAAVRFLASLAERSSLRERLETTFGALHERGEALVTRLWQGLAQVEGVRLFGPPPEAERTPTVSFVLRNQPAQEVSRFLAERGVFVSHGDFYATTVARRLGCTAQGLVRAGCACYTTDEEVDRLIEGVQALASSEEAQA